MRGHLRAASTLHTAEWHVSATDMNCTSGPTVGLALIITGWDILYLTWLGAGWLEWGGELRSELRRGDRRCGVGTLELCLFVLLLLVILLER